MEAPPVLRVNRFEDIAAAHWTAIDVDCMRRLRADVAEDVMLKRR
jgi:hypothetical protein